MAVFQIKQNDTAPSIAADLKSASKEAIDLTGATVRFNMKDQDGNLIVDNQESVITDAAGGGVRYDWQTGDTATEGTHYAEFEVTYSGGTIETFPNSTNIKVKIAPEVG